MAEKEQEGKPVTKSQSGVIPPQYNVNPYGAPPPGPYGYPPPPQSALPPSSQVPYNYPTSAANYGSYPPPPASSGPYAQQAYPAPYAQQPPTGGTPSPPPAAYPYQTSPDMYGKPQDLTSSASAYQDHKNGSNFGDMTMITPDIDRSIRHAFVRKVYMILFTQVVITFAIATVCTLVKPVAFWLAHNLWLAILCIVLACILQIILICVPSVSRRVPINFVLLSIITLFYSVFVGFLAAVTSSSAFYLAAGITGVVVLALSIFACQTRMDFTGCGIYFIVAFLVLLLFGILSAFFYSRILNIVYASVGALIVSLLIVYDTQLIVGGKHRQYQFSIDDYICAALTLYMDCILLFTYILQLTDS